MYISNTSGHHRACLAVENALHLLDRDVETKSINSFNYTNPILEKIINRTYMAVIKRRPEVWEYLYDNPVVVKKTQRLKESIHKFNSGKMKALLDGFNPSAVICTQAFPCGIVADLKRTYNLTLPLIAVLTDYAPHSYWVYNDVDAYVVPSEETGQKLVENGVSLDKIRPLGIPVDPKFYVRSNKERILSRYSLDGKKPIILIMGGGQGLGPIKKLVLLLEKSTLDLQLIVITGTNKKLCNYLRFKKRSFKKNVLVFPFTENINDFMEISTAIITKPGGLTTAEALSMNLPIIIANPLPGQEAMNTKFLLEKRLAIKAKDEKETIVLLKELLNNPEKLTSFRKNIERHAKPDASLRIAKLTLEMASQCSCT